MSHAAREKAEAEILREVLDIERQEAALVWQAQEAGLPIEHRAACSPLAVLGIRLVTVPARASRTSAGHAYDIR